MSEDAKADDAAKKPETTDTAAAVAEEKKDSVELSPKLEEVLKTIEQLTALELSELVKGIEDKFGVQAVAPMAMGAVMPGAGAAGGGPFDSHAIDPPAGVNRCPSADIFHAPAACTSASHFWICLPTALTLSGFRHEPIRNGRSSRWAQASRSIRSNDAPT